MQTCVAPSPQPRCIPLFLLTNSPRRYFSWHQRKENSAREHLQLQASLPILPSCRPTVLSANTIIEEHSGDGVKLDDAYATSSSISQMTLALPSYQDTADSCSCASWPETPLHMGITDFSLFLRSSSGSTETSTKGGAKRPSTEVTDERPANGLFSCALVCEGYGCCAALASPFVLVHPVERTSLSIAIFDGRKIGYSSTPFGGQMNPDDAC